MKGVNKVLERIEGVIIKTQNYQESHKIVTIFSGKLGKFSAIARGATKPKSRMAALTQPFILGDFLIYVNPGLSTIQQGEIINANRAIREDIERTAYASYVTELTEKVLEVKQPDSYLYKQFLLTLEWIAKEEDVDIPILMYEMKVFQKGGFAPIVDKCIHCQNKQMTLTAFSIKEGGLLCHKHVHLDPHPINLPQAIIKMLPILLHVGLERIGNISVSEKNKQILRKMMDLYYDNYGSFTLKTKRFLKQLDQLK